MGWASAHPFFPMRDRILAFLVLLPSVLAVGVFVYGFIGQNLWVSLTDWGRTRPRPWP